MDRILECVPNFSEGRDPEIIEAIARAVREVDGVALLDVDPGRATHRTVMTFAGDPDQVVEAAVRSAAAASELIDMRKHQGEHPRFGALDVCPLIPIRGISMEEAVHYAHQLARRLGNEVGLTVYCYEHAAKSKERKNLASIRAGEYEGLPEKLAQQRWKPDFGPAEFNPRSGATAVGARDFLIAYNINLNTTSTRRANAVAFDVREKGRIKRRGNPLTGEIVRDNSGEPVYEPGSLKSVKAIGWFIEEYGIAQISMNLTDISVTPIHVAFDEVCRRAQGRGMRVTGSELVGLVPLNALLEAGRHYLRRQQRSLGVPDDEVLKIAVKSLGLSDLKPFDPSEKVIEYRLAQLMPGRSRLIDRSVREFVEETASESPAPGGGSVAAAIGAFGAALGVMVANLSAHKKGWDDRWEEFSERAEEGKTIYEALLSLVDRDTDSFNAVLAAYRLPENTQEEKRIKGETVQRATRAAMTIPLEVMQTATRALELLRSMADVGNPASVTDAGVGALCIRSAIRGAHLNVKINAAGIDDKDFVRETLEIASSIEDSSAEMEATILELVESKL